MPAPELLSRRTVTNTVAFTRKTQILLKMTQSYLDSRLTLACAAILSTISAPALTQDNVAESPGNDPMTVEVSDMDTVQTAEPADTQAAPEPIEENAADVSATDDDSEDEISPISVNRRGPLEEVPDDLEEFEDELDPGPGPRESRFEKIRSTMSCRWPLRLQPTVHPWARTWITADRPKLKP